MFDTVKVAALAVRLRLRPFQVRWALLTVQTCARSSLFPTTDARQRAADVVLATELVESGLKNYANGYNPESLRIPHDAVGWDHGSVGILQQQVGGAPHSNADWGTTAQCMDVAHAVGHFLRVLNTKGWNLSNGQLAQAVQGSAYPDRYAQQDARAITIRRACWSLATAKTTITPPKTKPPTKTPASNPKAGTIVVVRKGDNLTTVARRYAVSVAALEKANPRAGHPAGHFNVVWPGDRLRLPS